MSDQSTIRSIGTESGVVIPESLLSRFGLDVGDPIHLIEMEAGILVIPHDPDFADAMEAYRVSAKKYRNAMRKLAE